jgi:hypothetical protein
MKQKVPWHLYELHAMKNESLWIMAGITELASLA